MFVMIAKLAECLVTVLALWVSWVGFRTLIRYITYCTIKAAHSHVHVCRYELYGWLVMYSGTTFCEFCSICDGVTKCNDNLIIVYQESV